VGYFFTEMFQNEFRHISGWATFWATFLQNNPVTLIGFQMILPRI
jgi:hypothetical protein